MKNYTAISNLNSPSHSQKLTGLQTSIILPNQKLKFTIQNLKVCRLLLSWVINSAVKCLNLFK